MGKELNGRYKIKRQLGAGGMALVYEARDTLLDRDVALKILRPQMASEKKIIRRFKREAKAVARLAHPNIVNIYDIGRDGDLHFLVMEKIKGGNLKEKIKKEGPLSSSEAIGYMIQLSEALVLAHRNDIIHCDIKPHNLLLDERGQLKVTDFGIARALSSTTMTHTERVMGSAHYFSPEQARGGKITASSDLYSLGVVLYELVTGEVPFTGDSPVSVALKHINREPQPPSNKGEVPEVLEKIILRLLQKEEDQRYTSAEELLSDLKSARLKLKKRKRESRWEQQRPTKIMEPIKDQGVEEQEEERVAVSGIHWPKILVIALVLGLVLVVSGVFIFQRYMHVPEVEVPTLLGLDEEEAFSFMEEVGLSLDVGERLYSSDYEEGEVMAQYPEDGSVVKQNRTVIVDISKGSRLTEVPDVTGMRLREARIRLDQSRLEVGEEKEEYDDQAPEGSVILQDPSPEREVESGSSVDLVISSGVKPEMVEVPRLTGLSEEDALKLLEDSGLRPGQLEKRESLSQREGTIIEQDPQPGEELPRGTTMDLILSSGIKNPEGDPVRDMMVRFIVPTTEPTDVTIRVIDNNGERVEYQSRHQPGEWFSHQVIGVGETTIMVYLDEQFWLQETID